MTTQTTKIVRIDSLIHQRAKILAALEREFAATLR